MSWGQAFRGIGRWLGQTAIGYEIGAAIHRSPAQETKVIVEKEVPKIVNSDNGDMGNKIYYLLIILIVSALIFLISRMACKPTRKIERIPLNEI